MLIAVFGFTNEASACFFFCFFLSRTQINSLLNFYLYPVFSKVGERDSNCVLPVIFSGSHFEILLMKISLLALTSSHFSSKQRGHVFRTYLSGPPFFISSRIRLECIQKNLALNIPRNIFLHYLPFLWRKYFVNFSNSKSLRKHFFFRKADAYS